MSESERTPATLDQLRHHTVHQHEPEVQNPPSWREWSTILIGPVIWLTHFFVVYFLAEDVCAEVTYGTTGSPVSESSMRTIVLVVTAIAAICCVALGGSGWSKVRAGSDSFAIKVGTVLSFGSAFGVLLVGLGAIWVGTC